MSRPCEGKQGAGGFLKDTIDALTHIRNRVLIVTGSEVGAFCSGADLVEVGISEWCTGGP